MMTPDERAKIEAMARDYFHSPNILGDLKHSDIEKAFIAGAKAMAEMRPSNMEVLEVMQKSMNDFFDEMKREL